MLQEAMNAWLLEHPEEEEQWLQVKGFLRFLGFSVAYILGTNPLAPYIRDRNDKCRIKGKKPVGDECRYFLTGTELWDNICSVSVEDSDSHSFGCSGSG
jgi:hypothetical protein